jgi:S1-C subfamily serine protease
MINSLSGLQDDWGRFQFSAQALPGNSGGALLNDLGNVVGVVVSGISGGPDVNYAIKANRVRAFVEEASVSLKQPKTGPKLTGEEIATLTRASTVKVISYSP